MTYRLGVDIGGTFTDLILLSAEGRMLRRKVPSTPDDYARGIIDGCTRLFEEEGVSPADVAEVIHGTTVASNTILELKGARTGLLTTRGFRDVLEIRRLRMPRLYDMAWDKPQPLVPRYLRREVPERIDRHGQVLRPLDHDAARRELNYLLDQGVESIAVSLLNAYVSGEHEQALKRLILELAPGIHVSLSSEVLPEIGEYERTSTTVINAYIQPVVKQYLLSLRHGLNAIGIRAPLLIMQSNGGVMGWEIAGEKPIHIVESGPAAGVIGAANLLTGGHSPNTGNIITFDMGGTTAKASIVEEGRVSRASEYEVGGGINVGNSHLKGGGYLLRVPAIDIAEVGAGGGSIVWIDKGGSLRVGPTSAGANPGPVCYNLGGTRPTVTDANVILGYLNPDYLVKGMLPLDRDKACSVFEREIARPLGLSLEEAAYGARLIANANMIRAVKAVSTERGRDPRSFTLVAFGGNGGVHGIDIARELDIKRVIIPPAAGLFSAFGLLTSDVEQHFVRTYLERLDQLAVDNVTGIMQQMEAEARQALAADGYEGDTVVMQWAADLRYAGQSHELTVALPDRLDGTLSLAELAQRFGEEHERTYGHRAENDPVELVNLRLTAVGMRNNAIIPARLMAATSSHDHGHISPEASRPVYFGKEWGWVDTPVYGREHLAGLILDGPVIIEEYDSTTVVPPDAEVTVDEQGNIVVTLQVGV